MENVRKPVEDLQSPVAPVYADHEEKRTASAIGGLLDGYSAKLTAPKSRKTERGELLKYFSTKLGMSIPRVAGHLVHLKELKDLYYLKSVCDQDTGRKYIDQKTGEEKKLEFGQVFWTNIKPRV